jgi:hypothetical protein
MNESPHPKQQAFTLFTWTIFTAALLVPTAVWANNIGWSLSSVSLYSFFPLLGLIAWMMMWTHYASGAFRITNAGLKKPNHYSKVSNYIVLAAIVLHPGLLALAAFQASGALPPFSLYDYRSDLMLAVLLGTVGWFIFISYEYFSRAKNKPWVKKLGPAISISQSLAMILIFIHGLQLGADLGGGWFRGLWIVYGALLLPCFYIIHKADFTKPSEK